MTVDLPPEGGNYRSVEERGSVEERRNVEARAVGIAHAVGEAGGRALVVGGWVRDRLIGRPALSERTRSEVEGVAPNVDIEVFGIERWELWGIGLRCRIKVLPHERDNVRREFTRRLVAEFDRRQIKSP